MTGPAMCVQGSVGGFGLRGSVSSCERLDAGGLRAYFLPSCFVCRDMSEIETLRTYSNLNIVMEINSVRPPLSRRWFQIPKVKTHLQHLTNTAPAITHISTVHVTEVSYSLRHMKLIVWNPGLIAIALARQLERG